MSSFSSSFSLLVLSLFLLLLLLLLLHPTSSSSSSSSSTYRVPIVYVYTVVPAVCKWGLPDYIKKSLEQAIRTQPDSEVIMASNFIDCALIRNTVDKIPGLSIIDISVIASEETVKFKNLSIDIFQSDYSNELWMTGGGGEGSFNGQFSL